MSDEIQPELFDRISRPLRSAAARRTDPQTSKDAAKKVEATTANPMEGKVLEAIRASNGLTNHEIVAATGLSWNTCSPRIRPLVRKGLVEDSGERREGPSGKKCIVWKSVNKDPTIANIR